MTAYPCPGPCDAGVRGDGKYLCLSCWSGLPLTTRRALYRKDPTAGVRLIQLHKQLRQQVPLSEIEVTP